MTSKFILPRSVELFGIKNRKCESLQKSMTFFRRCRLSDLIKVFYF